MLPQYREIAICVRELHKEIQTRLSDSNGGKRARERHGRDTTIRREKIEKMAIVMRSQDMKIA